MQPDSTLVHCITVETRAREREKGRDGASGCIGHITHAEKTEGDLISMLIFPSLRPSCSRPSPSRVSLLLLLLERDRRLRALNRSDHTASGGPPREGKGRAANKYRNRLSISLVTARVSFGIGDNWGERELPTIDRFFAWKTFHHRVSSRDNKIGGKRAMNLHLEWLYFDPRCNQWKLRRSWTERALHLEWAKVGDEK